MEEFYARMAVAVEGTPYRLVPTERGFDMTVDVDVPKWQGLLTRYRIDRVHTYRVALRPQTRTYTITDIVRTLEFGVGVGGVRLGRSVFIGRSGYTTADRPADGSPAAMFASAEGHRVIREAAGELGWREAQPLSVKIALGFAVLGGAGAIAALVTLAVVHLL